MQNSAHLTTNKILFATTEVFPIIKTGGLADVSAGLPSALHSMGVDIKIVLPAYAQVLNTVTELSVIKTYTPALPFRVLEGKLEHTAVSSVTIWLIDIPQYFNREGNPYTMVGSADWPDNAERFAAFCRAVYALALGHTTLMWQPDIVHCNDWPTGLIPAFLARHQQRPATVFTIHNLAYQGIFNQETFTQLGLPANWWSMHGLEFHGQFSFIKGGLVFADILNTVSPTYANEIRTPMHGQGLDGLLNHRRQHLSGILNGIDYAQWNPATDTNIIARYHSGSITAKYKNKTALQQHFKLAQAKNTPLIGVIGRIVEQKGFDLILLALPELLKLNLQIVMLGAGHHDLEQSLAQAARQYPNQIGLQLGYDETLAHRIEAGADMFLMPSRFEPCGLNQIYSLRYGTVPIVHHTGGLADSVVDTNEDTLNCKIATGFMFHQAEPSALVTAVLRALQCYQQKSQWRQLIRTGMDQDFSWTVSAQKYLELYQKAQKSQ